MIVDEQIREKLGDHYENRRILVLRMLAINSDPDLFSENRLTQTEAKINNRHLSQILGREWNSGGRRGPQYATMVRWTDRLIDSLDCNELCALHEQAFEWIAEALPPNGVPV